MELPAWVVFGSTEELSAVGVVYSIEELPAWVVVDSTNELVDSTVELPV